MQAERAVANRKRVAEWLRKNLDKRGLNAVQFAVLELGMKDGRLVQKWLAQQVMPSGDYLLMLEEKFGPIPAEKTKRRTLRFATLSEQPRPRARTSARSPHPSAYPKLAA